MTPLKHFEAVWERCSQLSAMQAFLAANVVGALKPDELLRAEWVARISALDLYVHELVTQRMLAVFESSLPKTPAYCTFMFASDAVDRIRHAPKPTDASAAFDLEVRRQLGFLSYQYPDKIADGIRMCSTSELWNAIALHQDRRNKIAHEGDLQPKTLPIIPWPISQSDLTIVSEFIEKLVYSIEACV